MKLFFFSESQWARLGDSASQGLALCLYCAFIISEQYINMPLRVREESQTLARTVHMLINRSHLELALSISR